jgi:hypothetical protein
MQGIIRICLLGLEGRGHVEVEEIPGGVNKLILKDLNYQFATWFVKENGGCFGNLRFQGPQNRIKNWRE